MKTNTKKPKPAPVWSSARSLEEDAKLCIAYCAGRDLAGRPPADESLIPYDLQTNRAHCAMLCRCEIISGKHLAAIERGLRTIEKDWERGNFKLDAALEDVHINVERAVALISGEEVAGVMHTARSRNDQTATDIRLYLRAELLRTVESVAGTIQALARFAKRHAETVLAGWTHGQPAMPTTLGHWAASHAQALARDQRALCGLWDLINQSPLGAAAGFGSSWPIDRRLTAQWLGFDAPQANSLDCVSTRWEAEARFAFALSILMTHLSSLGQDLIYLSSPPRSLVELDAAFTTGSSIMPQKRNPDFAEVTRARAASVQSIVAAIGSTGRGALSGYNRDSQWTKYWIMDAVSEVGSAPALFARVIETLKPNRVALEDAAREEFISAVDLADHLAATRKIEFRRLYHLIGETVRRDRSSGQFKLETINALLAREEIHPPLTGAELKEFVDPKLAVKRRQSLGSPAPDQTLRQADQLFTGATGDLRWVALRRGVIEKSQKLLREAIETMTR